jgi:hypothetical protein
MCRNVFELASHPPTETGTIKQTTFWDNTHTHTHILGYGLEDRGSRVQFPAGAGNFSLHHRIHNSSGTHSASYTMGIIRGSFPVGKAAEA